MSVLLNTDDPRPVHFVGIAGAGMSGLALLLSRRGVSVQGTDANPLGAPDLGRAGIPVHAHDAALIAGVRAVVYSSAIPASHPEMLAAHARGLPVIRRAEALGAAVQGGTVIGVAGTHGKTTTTVLLTDALAGAHQDPTGVAGGRVGAWGGNLRAGTSDLYVVEADEYDRSFLALDPTVAVVLNIEADHLDIYRDLDDIHATFTQFCQPARAIVVCADDQGAMSLPYDAARELLPYSVEGCAVPSSHTPRLVARDVTLDASGAQARVEFDGAAIGVLELSVPGLHNVRNALAAIGAGLLVGADPAGLLAGVADFSGVERRYQRIGAAGGVQIVDDYAHHPTEVTATIEAARAAHPTGRLVIAFQPHLFSRTRDFAAQFGEALARADACFLCDIYPAREAPIAGVTSALVADVMHRAGRPPVWQGPRDACAAALAGGVSDGDVVLTMGAGDITRVGPELLQLLQEREAP
jgi:UDP-N-acetylmuramate--alanine ligase